MITTLPFRLFLLFLDQPTKIIIIWGVSHILKILFKEKQ